MFVFSISSRMPSNVQRERSKTDPQADKVTAGTKTNNNNRVNLVYSPQPAAAAAAEDNDGS